MIKCKEKVLHPECSTNSPIETDILLCLFLPVGTCAFECSFFSLSQAILMMSPLQQDFLRRHLLPSPRWHPNGCGLMSKPKGSCKQTGELALCWKIAREVLPFGAPFIILGCQPWKYPGPNLRGALRPPIKGAFRGFGN